MPSSSATAWRLPPLRWSADPAWKLDYSNIALLPPAEIARRRAEFDRQKEIAKIVRVEPDTAG